MISYPFAKINLGLNILGKRQDGYHDIETIFLPVDWKDILEIVPDNESKSKEKVHFSSSGLKIEGDSKNNLIIKAYNILDNLYDLPPVKIHLHKIIPMGGGLGGGSSDATFSLKMLSDIFKLNLELNEIKSISTQIGSDCAFFAEGKPVFACGKGDTLEEIKINLKDKIILLVWPGIFSNTALAYSNIIPKKPEKSIKEIIQLPIDEWKHFLVNNFENSVFKRFEEIEKIKLCMYEFGALYASMSGSGSTVFGIFDNNPNLLDWPKNYLIHLSKLS